MFKFEVGEKVLVKAKVIEVRSDGVRNNYKLSIDGNQPFALIVPEKEIVKDGGKSEDL